MINTSELLLSSALEVHQYFEKNRDGMLQQNGYWVDTAGCSFGASEIYVGMNIDVPDSSKEFSLIKKLPARDLVVGREYEVLIGTSCEDPFALNRTLIVESRDPAEGLPNWLATEHLRSSPMQRKHHTWSRLQFIANTPNMDHNIVMNRPNKRDEGLVIHDLLVRPICADVYWLRAGKLFYNGAPVAE